MIHFILYSKIKQTQNKILDKINQALFSDDMDYRIHIFDQIMAPNIHKNKIYLIDICSFPNVEEIESIKKLPKTNYPTVLILEKDMPIDFFCGFYNISIFNLSNQFEKQFASFIHQLKEQEQEETILIKHRETLYYLREKDILFIYTDASRKKTIIVTDYTKMEINKPLNKIFDELKKDSFIQTHRSCIVNKRRIQWIDYKKRIITFDNGTNIDLFSVRSIKNVKSSL